MQGYNNYKNMFFPWSERREVLKIRRYIRSCIRDTWPATVERSRVRESALSALPKSPVLLGQSEKTLKSISREVETRVVYLAAHKASGAPTSLCPDAVPECIAACIGRTSGRMPTPGCQKAQLWKTALFLGNRWLYMGLLECEIWLFFDSCASKGRDGAVRADGSSDTGAGRYFAELAGNMGEHRNYPNQVFCDFQMYDYTKSFSRAFEALGSDYHLTLSYTGRNEHECKTLLAAGGVVAVVFDTRDSSRFPAELWGYPVYNGDDDDLTYLAPAGTIRALTLKGVQVGSCGIFTKPAVPESLLRIDGIGRTCPGRSIPALG